LPTSNSFPYTTLFRSFRDFFDHHRLQLIGAKIEKVSLAADDHLADAQDGVLALLDVLEQLDGGGKALLDVVAHFAVGGVARQQRSEEHTSELQSPDHL